jgi:hypothetical protein
MSSRALRTTIGVCTLLSWSLYGYFDYWWTQTLITAVKEQRGKYGEIYGPLTFAKPASFWLAIFLTIACIVLMQISVRSKKL